MSSNHEELQGQLQSSDDPRAAGLERLKLSAASKDASGSSKRVSEEPTPPSPLNPVPNASPHSLDRDSKLNNLRKRVRKLQKKVKKRDEEMNRVEGDLQAQNDLLKNFTNDIANYRAVNDATLVKMGKRLDGFVFRPRM